MHHRWMTRGMNRVSLLPLDLMFLSIGNMDWSDSSPSELEDVNQRSPSAHFDNDPYDEDKDDCAGYIDIISVRSMS